MVLAHPLPGGAPWIDQPLVAHELTTLRTGVNRHQRWAHPSGNSRSPPHWGLNLHPVPDAALQNLSSLSPFILMSPFHSPDSNRKRYGAT